MSSGMEAKSQGRYVSAKAMSPTVSKLTVAISKFSAYRSYGGLWVTWAAVLPADLNGVERYLADQFKPLIGDRHPDVKPIPVNLPWAA